MICLSLKLLPVFWRLPNLIPNFIPNFVGAQWPRGFRRGVARSQDVDGQVELKTTGFLLVYEQENISKNMQKP